MNNEIEKATDSLTMIERERQRINFTEYHLSRTENFAQRIKMLEDDLAAERARLDWVSRNCKVTADDLTTGNRDVYAIHDREDLGAAMKEDAK
jgi:hypothetical protein